MTPRSLVVGVAAVVVVVVAAAGAAMVYRRGGPAPGRTSQGGGGAEWVEGEPTTAAAPGERVVPTLTPEQRAAEDAAWRTRQAQDARQVLTDPAQGEVERAAALDRLIDADPAEGARALEELLSQLALDGRGPLLAAALRAAARGDVEGLVDAAAVTAIALRVLERTDDPDVALAAAEALARFPAAARDVAAVLPRVTLPEARVGLVRSLELSADPEARATLLDLHRHDAAPAVQAEALAVLAQRGDAAARELAVEGLRGGAELRVASARILARSPGPETERALLDALAAETDPDAARGLACALAAREGGRAQLRELAVGATSRAEPATEGLAAAADEGALREVLRAGARPGARARALRWLVQAQRVKGDELAPYAQDAAAEVRDVARAALEREAEDG